MTYASKGIILDQNQKFFRLYDGKVINRNKINLMFSFDQIDIDLSEYSSNTILVPKIQRCPQKIYYSVRLITLIKNKYRQ